MPNIEWLLHAAADSRALKVDTRTEVADENWTATIDRLELDAGLRVYLVAADVARDMALEPRNTAIEPMLSSQLCIAGDVGIEFPDGVRARVARDRGLFFRPLANIATYRLRGGQRIKSAGYAFDVDRIVRIFDGAVPAPLQPLVEPEREGTRLLETRVSPHLRRLANGLFVRDLNGALRILYLEGVVLQLLALQAAAAEQRRLTSPRGASARERALVQEARERLLADMRETPTLGELAAAVGMTERRLNAGFRAVFGMTAFELLRDERLKHARIAIGSEDLPLKEVAYRVGYNHVTNFINAFTARFGDPPRRHVRPRAGGRRRPG